MLRTTENEHFFSNLSLKHRVFVENVFQRSIAYHHQAYLLKKLRNIKPKSKICYAAEKSNYKEEELSGCTEPSPYCPQKHLAG